MAETTAASIIDWEINARLIEDPQRVPWMARDVTLIWISQTGSIDYAQTPAQKRNLEHRAGPNDVLLLAWPGRWSQDIFYLRDADRTALREAVR